MRVIQCGVIVSPPKKNKPKDDGCGNGSGDDDEG